MRGRILLERLSLQQQLVRQLSERTEAKYAEEQDKLRAVEEELNRLLADIAE